MHQYHLTQHLSLTLKRCNQPFKWFTGKTNRLALYSLCLLGIEFDLYLERDWRYSPLDSGEE